MNSDTSTSFPAKTAGISLSLDRWLSRDWTAAAFLFLFSFLLRIPFRSQFLYHWDSVNFAYAMSQFNLAKEQPQPPGYILYVYLARFVNLAFHDPQTTLVAVSLVSSSLAVVLAFLVGKEIFNRTSGWIVAGLLATSPLFWFYSEIALPHTLDTLLVLGCIYLLFRVYRGDYRSLYPAVVLLAVAGGVRQQTLVFLLPVTLFAFFRMGLKRWLLAAGLGVLVCLAWFIPLIASTGGLANYLQITRQFSDRFQDTTSVFMGAGLAGIAHNVRKLVEYTVYAWGPALIAPLALGALLLRKKAFPTSQWGRWIFLALWALPALIFYTFIHMGQQGLIFVYLPALLLVSAYALERGLRNHQKLQYLVIVGLLGFNLVVFCFLPEFPLGAQGPRILNRNTVANSDQYYGSRIQAIRRNFSPKDTIILAVNWHHVEYYLPEYSKITMDGDVVAQELQSLPVPSQGEKLDTSLADWRAGLSQNEKVDLVIFDPLISAFIKLPTLSQTGLVNLSNGDTLQYLELKPGTHVHLGTGLVAFHP